MMKKISPEARLFTPWAVWLSASLCVSFATGCKCESTEKTTETSKKAEPQKPAKPPLPKSVDATLFAALEKAAADCEAGPNQAAIHCQGGDKNAIVMAFNRGEKKHVASLPTFVYALEQKNDKLQAVAASILYASFRKDLGSDVEKGAVDARVADELLSATLSLPAGMATHAIPATVHAMMLSNQEEKLFSALDDQVETRVKTMGYRYVMVYGRLSAFEQVKKLGSAEGVAVVLSAIESPRNMEDWTTEEQEAICPWAEPFLKDSRPAVAGNAAAVLGNCSGKYLDGLLSSLERSVKDHQVTFIHATTLRQICGPERRKADGAPTEKQCDKVRRLQETICKDDKIKARVRSMVLSGLAYVWPDEKTYRFAQTLAQDGAPEVVRTAKQITTRLEPRFSAK